MVLVPWPVLTEKSIDIRTVGIKVYIAELGKRIKAMVGVVLSKLANPKKGL